MLLFFLPPVVQVLIGVVIIVVGLAVLHSYIIAGIGLVGVAVGCHPLRPLPSRERVPAMSAIIVKDLVKRYGRFTAVQDVSFEVASGQVTALLGPNGAGKTTTIEILEGFLAPTAGTVQVLGANPRTGGRRLAGPDRAGPADHQPGRPAHGDRGADDVRGAVPEAAPGRPRSSTSSTWPRTPGPGSGR